MASALIEYFEALDRLKKGQPRVVPKGTKITQDAVSQEAGRGKGTIKKSRPIFADLITAIAEAAAEHPDPQGALTGKLVSAKGAVKKYRGLWEEALAREASLLMELYEAKKTIGKLTGDTVLPIRSKRH